MKNKQKQKKRIFFSFQGVELQTIVNRCTSNKKQIIDEDEVTKLEDILLRYLNFYCNLAETIVNELKQDNKDSKLYLIDPIPYRQGALYFELFDHVCFSQNEYFLFIELFFF